ncbi:nitrilase [Naematelia encephala]|uniref:Nitrilase n=1 Tax=Naematelia encephala TaxID=71784 RepID=A0A1Y2BMH7_9TREE|nr:nitrilase [Naematelia encephala]
MINPLVFLSNMPAPMLPIVKVAACHAAPVFLDTAATVQKGIQLIGEAAQAGADLVVFPEAWIPGFPLWSALASPTMNHDLFISLAREAIFVDGTEIDQLRAACKQYRIFAQIGFNERSKASLGCLFNATILISDEGVVLNHHRKLVPTFFEKLIWAPGDGAGLRVVETRIGRLGSLICGENGNGLARYSLMAQGEQLHVSHWPPIFPTRPPGEAGNFDLAGATRIRVAAHCFEAKCFGIVCASPLGAARDFLIQRDPSCAPLLEDVPQSSTMFLDPTGSQIGDELEGESEGIAYATFDLNKCIEPKQFHDFVGGYQRLDIFKLTINRTRHEPVVWEEDGRVQHNTVSAGFIPSAPSVA